MQVLTDQRDGETAATFGPRLRADGDVKAVEYDLAPGRTRWALLHAPADREPTRLGVPSD